MAGVRTTQIRMPLADYDLGMTLVSGQAFRWERSGAGWEAVICGRWVRLEPVGKELLAEAIEPAGDWTWLTDYLRLFEPLGPILESFPVDPPLTAARAACQGLRLLRQDPWECLASFILSSTKQIVQIRQCVALLCERFGDPVVVPPGHRVQHGFPEFGKLARAEETELRACKLGFRAPYLSGTARVLRERRLELEALASLTTPEARVQLMTLPGVGRKIADCVLLFAYGRQDAFPVDVWVLRALQQLYFPRRRLKPRALLRFTGTHFGPNAGYAQQYLFHYMRTHPHGPTAPEG